MSRDELIELLKEVVSLDVSSSSEYTGGMDDGPLYTTVTTVSLMIDGDVISSFTI